MWSPRYKLLKTWQLLASCEGGPSPSWWWHLNCPALAQWGRPPATTHTHFLLWWLKDKHNDTNCSQSLSFLTQVQLWMCALVHPTQIFTQWHSHKLSLNPSSHTPHSRYMANKTILLLIPTFTHTHTHKHTWIHTLELDHYALMYSGLSLQVTWPLLSCLSEGEEPIQPDGSRSERLWTTGRVNM